MSSGCKLCLTHFSGGFPLGLFKIQSCLQNNENILHAVLSCVDARIDINVYKSSSASITLVVLDNFYKLNCVLLVLLSNCFHYMVVCISA